MSTETEIQEVEQVETPEVKTTEVETPVEKPFRASAAFKAETPKLNTIPYARFKEIEEERDSHATQARELAAKLAKYEAQEAELAKIKDPDEINPADFDDPVKFLKARDAAILAKAEARFEEKKIEEQRATAIQVERDHITSTYSKNITAAIQRDPEIASSKEFFDSVAHDIHPEILRELALDEYVGELMRDIDGNRELLQQLAQIGKEGDPRAFIRTMHKMSAKINIEERYKKGEEDDSQSSGALAKAIAERPDDGIPRQVRASSGPVSGKRSLRTMSDAQIAKLSQSEYEKLRHTL
jgi:hypothetical protein